LGERPAPGPRSPLPAISQVGLRRGGPQDSPFGTAQLRRDDLDPGHPGAVAEVAPGETPQGGGMITRRVRVCHVITLLEPGGAQDNTLYTVSHLNAPFLPSLVCGRGGALDDEARGLRVPLRSAPPLVRPV